MLTLRIWSVRHALGLRRVYVLISKLAPLVAPLARVIGWRRAATVLRPLESVAKGLLFDCRMCGQCVLSATGMACPMNCAKEMRNGPCGGVRADGHCEVRPTLPCAWVQATAGAKRIASDHLAHPMPLLPALDQRVRGNSSWITVLQGRPEVTATAKQGPRVTPAAEQGVLERACNSGRFVVTVEVAPPDSASPSALLARAAKFEGLVDAINVTDGAGGNCHMSSVAASAILAAHGHTPVYQVACRDRNRIAIQGDILGAAALGVKNILCLTGDDVSQGDHPQAKPVFDLDAVSLLQVAHGMCDLGVYASGRKLQDAPDLFLGATINPFVPPYADRIANLEQKILAGARFIQTQFCFDLKMMEDFMLEVRRRGLHRRAHIIVGVGTLGSAKALSWMAQHVPGVHVPAQLLSNIERAANQMEQGKAYCIETIQALAGIEGVAGIHVMGHRNEDVLAEIISECGLRRQTRLRSANAADPQGA